MLFNVVLPIQKSLSASDRLLLVDQNKLNESKGLQAVQSRLNWWFREIFSENFYRSFALFNSTIKEASDWVESRGRKEEKRREKKGYRIWKLSVSLESFYVKWQFFKLLWKKRRILIILESAPLFSSVKHYRIVRFTCWPENPFFHWVAVEREVKPWPPTTTCRVLSSTKFKLTINI